MKIIEHAKCPQFCEACKCHLIESLPEGRSEHAGYCEHHNTVAQVSIEPTGRIRAWRLRGPLTEEAAAIMVEIGASMRAEIFARENNFKNKRKPH